MVVEDGVNLTGHKAQVVTPEHWLRLIASVRQNPRRACGDRALTHRRRFGEHPLRVELMAPIGDVADPPAHGRQGEAVRCNR